MAKQQTIVDRAGFVAWCNGILLHRTPTTLLVVNEPECRAADEALEAGEAVLFREKSKLTGTEVVLVDGEYVERPTQHKEIEHAKTDPRSD